MELSALRQRIKDLKPLLLQRGVTHVSLFGSRARNNARPNSDVDVLIEINGERSFSLFDLVGLESELTQRIGLQFSVVMRRSLSPAIASSIANEIVDVF